MMRRHTDGIQKRTDRGATPAEWAWLVCDRGHNPFFGFGTGQPGQATSRSRLAGLWERHKAEIWQHWATHGPPEKIPFGHPVEQELPEHLRTHARPDPRPTLAEEDPAALEGYRQRVRAWEEARREWFRKHTHHSTEDER